MKAGLNLLGDPVETEASHPYTSPSFPETIASRSLFRSTRFWIPTIVCLLAALAIPIAFIIGAVIGSTQIYHNFSSHQQSRIESFLIQHPESYGDLEVEHASNGWAYPIGTVPTQADHDRLSDELRTMFGDQLAEDMMRTVDVQH